jgi:COP9 signalosome complex subunit 3
LLASISAAQKAAKGQGWDVIWGKIEEFLTSFDNVQVRYVGKEFTHIIDVAVKYATSSGQVYAPRIHTAGHLLNPHRLRLQ